MIKQALKHKALYWHALPLQTQARKVIWDGICSDGVSFLDYIPKELVVRKRNDYMSIELVNGSIIQLVGFDQPDKLVGSNPMWVTFSEYALASPVGWDLIRPILSANGGRALFISTPRGMNHFHRLYKAALDNDRWHTELLSISDTKKPDGSPIITEAQVQEDIDGGMPAELADQEYRVSFTAAMVGSIFGTEMELAALEGRVGDVPWRKDYPVWTAWDLGVDDMTSIWFAQMDGQYVNLIDYYQSFGVGLDHYAKFCQDKPYIYKRHLGPHDLAVREMSTGKTRLETARDLGIKFRVVPRSGLEDGINAARLFINRCRFDEEKCEEGIAALQQYRREWSPKNRIWSPRPVHDEFSHGADSFRYMALGVPRRGGSSARPLPSGNNTFKDIKDGILDKARRDRASRSKRRWV